jgi:hypothetical protein
MPDKTKDVDLNNPTKSQSENSPLKTPQIIETDTINIIQETENMEVHHHAHHGHEKKTWKNYFWEFLMLFLAVFCGFLAELQLEHTIEHSREKEFIVSMIKELENDDKQINEVLKDTIRNNKLDSLAIYLVNLDNNVNNVNRAYILKNNITSYYPMIFNRSTISQLKNGGNMRLIRNRKVVDSINLIDNLIDVMVGQINSYDIITLANVQTMAKIFDVRYYLKFKRDNNKLNGIEFINQQADLKYLSSDEKLRIEFAEQVLFQKGSFENYVDMLKHYQVTSRRMVMLFKKEYHLN